MNCKKDAIRCDKHHHADQKTIEIAGFHNLPSDVWKAEQANKVGEREYLRGNGESCLIDVCNVDNHTIQRRIAEAVSQREEGRPENVNGRNYRH